MTAANAVFFSISIPLVIALYVTFLYGEWKQRKAEREDWERRMKEKSGVFYIGIEEVMKIAWEVKKG